MQIKKLLRKKNQIISYGGVQHKVRLSPEVINRVDIGRRRLPSVYSRQEKKRIAIIGAGWYGVHIACELKKKHPAWEITLFEKNSKIFSGVSGMFGIRLHAGPHYPRSKATRDDCHKGFWKFYECYPDIITENGHAFYGLSGIPDADGNPSKVTEEEFAKVCEEFGEAKPVQTKAHGFRGLTSLYDLKEPSVQVGKPLRQYFEKKLKRLGIAMKRSAEVLSIDKKVGEEFTVEYSRGSKKKRKVFDHVIDTTNYQAFPSVTSTNEIEVVYQVCTALEYKHKVKSLPNDPFSSIVMDGWYPCIMPYDDRIDKSKPVSKYILTHGKWTIMSTFKTAEEAHEYLAKLNDRFIEQKVKPKCEEEVQRFYPAFCQEFKYKGWKGAVLAKPKTNNEFRSAVAFRDETSQQIKVISGKISNIFDAEEDVSKLLKGEGIIRQGNISYPKDGAFDRAQSELAEKPQIPSQSTTELQSFPDIPHNSSFFFRRSNSTLVNACRCLGLGIEEQEDVAYYNKNSLIDAKLAGSVESLSHSTTHLQFSSTIPTISKSSGFFAVSNKRSAKKLSDYFSCVDSEDRDNRMNRVI